MMLPLPDPFFNHFNRTILPEELPEKFTFPFYYTPVPLAVEACNLLMAEMEANTALGHNFGLEEDKYGSEIGKMFGILVVKGSNNEIGYLKAFSGKLADSNEHPGFVPPIYDMLQPDGFFLKGESELSAISKRISMLENDAHYMAASISLQEAIKERDAAILALKKKLRQNKEARERQRVDQEGQCSKEEYELLLAGLIKQSYSDKHAMKICQEEWHEKTELLQQKVSAFKEEIEAMKAQRKETSRILQGLLFDQYNFINSAGVYKNVREIFAGTAAVNPPSAAGECATTKLVQYALVHNMQPIALAEFWWGKSPASEVRKHRQYYPACRGKCEPILAHMLLGIEMDDNPMLHFTPLTDDLENVYEDDYIVVVNKPTELLSVPGKNIYTSVLTILQQRYPNATGPLLVHRLDMGTSGLLIAAKTKEAHHHLQSQFIKKTAVKRYVALLDGSPDEDGGVIDLPLRVDLDNRPNQLVCFDYGKFAKTRWEVVERNEVYTRVHFYPITGRTHQLRVHAAHPMGLNRAIVGDDLYGTKGTRLHLHAEYLEITHPVTKQRMSFTAKAPF